MKRLFYVFGIALLLIGCKTTTKVGGNKAGMMDYGSPRVKQELIDDQMFLIKNTLLMKRTVIRKRIPLWLEKKVEAQKTREDF